MGGLHCGLLRQARAAGAPAFRGRAPLRQCSGRAGWRCSRLSWAGSIAATVTYLHRRQAVRGVLPPFNGGLHCGRRSASRRPLAEHAGAPAFRTAGSIAAGTSPAPARRRRAGAPAFQRRAPLRRRSPYQRRCRARPVLPPFNGGLHCGSGANVSSDTADNGCSRLSTAGSIAADQNGDADRLATPGAPAFRGRAPLRRFGTGEVSWTGCSRLRGRAPLRPRARGHRLRCAGAPAFRGRAPLRQAPCGMASVPARPGAPAFRTAGSIAARSGPAAAIRRAAVLPPFIGGLHCGWLRPAGAAGSH